MEEPRNMTHLGSGEETLNFNPFFKGSEASLNTIRVKRFSPYKYILFLHDLIIVAIAFVIGGSLSGVGYQVFGDLRQSITLLIFVWSTIAFFATYYLYNNHLIFLCKNHLLNLAKALSLSALTLSIIVFLFLYPQILDKIFIIPIIIIAALGALFLSRMLGSDLLDPIKSLGLSFLAIGILAMTYPDEKPIFIINWLTIPLSFFLAVLVLLGSRIFLVQVIFNKWMRRHFRRQIAVVGSDEEARKIGNHIITQNAPFWVSGIIGKEDVKSLDVLIPKERLGKIEDFPQIVQQKDIHEIIVTDEDIDQRLLISLLDYCTSEGITVWFPPKLLPIIDMKIYIDNFCGLPMIRLCSQKNTWIFDKIKHGFDALISLPVLSILLPFFFLLGIIIKRDSQGPVFYKAKAIGKNAQKFEMYKFRSMKISNNCEIHKEYVTKLIRGDIKAEDDDKKIYKIQDDPRITSVGRVLRKYSIDELPQIINVLKGKMSLVGPRPCLPYEYELYKDWQKKRLSVRPGITGLWQVAGRSAVTFEDMILLDLYYIYNRNLLMDINIIYETLFVVFEKQGAF